MADRIIGLENGKIVLNDLKENALKSDNIFKSFFDAEKRMTFIKGDDIDE
jgi:ABC-type enterochelin transport system ATPase subunit